MAFLRGITSTEFETSAALAAQLDALTDAVALLTTVSSQMADLLINQQDMLENDTETVLDIPPVALSATKRYSTAQISNGNSSSDQAIVGATASQTTRLHRILISVGAACLIELRDGTTTKIQLRTTGAAVIPLDFGPDEPGIVGTANTALNIKTTPAVQLDVFAEYVKSV